MKFPTPKFCMRLVGFFALALGPISAPAAILGINGPLIYSINETTGSSVVLHTGSTLGAISMAKNSAGLIYVAGDGGTGFESLYTVDPATGIATQGPVLNLPSLHISGLAFNAADVLYAVGSQSGVVSLVTINTTTGVVTSVGTITGPGSVSGLEFSPTGVLYAWEQGGAGRGLVTINPASAAVTDVNPAVGDGGLNIETLAFSSSGVLYGARSSLYTIDPITGVATLVAAFSPATTVFGMEFINGGPSGPAVSLSPPSLAFGNQQVATTSAAQTLTLQNIGTATLDITTIAATGDFAQSNACGATLAAGASCVIDVTFTPTTTGARSGSLSVASDAPGSPHSSALAGTGVTSPPPPPPPPATVTSVPTLSQWSLFALALLLAFTSGVRLMRSGRRPR